MNRLTRLFPIVVSLLGGALMFGCTDEATAPSGPEFAIAQAEPETLREFTICQPQPYAAASGWIGPNGGTLKAGKHRFWVPAGALNEPVFITMEIPSGYINRVVFRPQGLVFNSKNLPHLLMRYTDCPVSPGVNQQIASFNATLGIIEPTPSDNDPVSLTVDGRVTQLSDYVLLSTYAVVY